MNDFLTRVVQRHRGEVPTVRPRPAPLFAPGLEPAPGQFSESVTWFEPAPARASEPANTAKPEPLVMPSLETPLQIDTARLPVVRRVVDVPSSEGRPNRESDSDAPTGHAPARQRRTVDEEHAPGPERMAPPPSPPAIPHVASEAAAALPLRILTERVTHTERVEVIQPLVRRDVFPDRPIDAPRSLIAAPVSARRSGGLDNETPEPPVHVTIGRIEVTAVAAPPSPKRTTATRQPSMSLREYLARRHGKEGSA